MTSKWPTVALTGSVSDQRTGLLDEVKRSLPDPRAVRGAIDLGWEVDMFGAARAAADAAGLDALAAQAGQVRQSCGRRGARDGLAELAATDHQVRRLSAGRTLTRQSL